MDEAEAGASDMLGRRLVVRRRSTGHAHVYFVAQGQPWLFNAFADLSQGRFGAGWTVMPAGFLALLDDVAFKRTGTGTAKLISMPSMLPVDAMRLLARFTGLTMFLAPRLLR